MSRLILQTLILSAAAMLFNAAAVAQSLPTLSNTQSAVTVKATPRNLKADIWEFELVFDTHSQELKDDLLKSASLVPAGGTPIAPTEWKGDPPGGHHRQGVLRFNAVKPMPETVELRIDRAGESKQRSFRWTVK